VISFGETRGSNGLGRAIVVVENSPSSTLTRSSQILL